MAAGGGGHGHNDIHLVGHEVCTDLVQVGLVSLGVGVVIGIVEGHALLRAHLIQTALNRGHDLVQGSMIHIVDDAHLKGLEPASEAAAAEPAALEAVLDAAAEEPEEPQPVRPSADTTAAAAAAFRKLRREIMFMVFIAVAPFPERAAQKINPLHLRNG